MKKLFAIPLVSLLVAQMGYSQKKKEEELGYVYILPVGDTPELFYGTEANGEGGKLQIDPPSGEMIPFSMYIDGASIPKKLKKYTSETEGSYSVSLRRNRSSKPILIKKHENGFSLVNRPEPGTGSSISWSIPVPKSAESLSVVTPKQYKRRPWASPLIKTIDCSLQKIPAGSIYIVNLSPYQVFSQSGKVKKVINEGQAQLIKTKGNVRVPLILKAKKQKMMNHLHQRWIETKIDEREIIVIYPSVKSSSKIKVGLCKTSLPLKPSMEWLAKRSASKEKEPTAQ